MLFILFHYYIIKGEDEKISNQEKIEQKLRTEQEEGQHQMTENLLNSIKENPEMWRADRLAYLRDFCSYATRNLPHCPGDDTVELPVQQALKESRQSCRDVTLLCKSLMICVISDDRLLIRRGFKPV